MAEKLTNYDPAEDLGSDEAVAIFMAEDRIQGSDSEWIVRRNCDAMVRRKGGLKDDVTAYLMDFQVVPALAEVLNQFFSAEIAWKFHATASTSSRIRCRRMEAGAAESK
jgi:hypothetical protein